MRWTDGGTPIIRILGARVLVQRLPLPETVASGLYLLGREYPTLARVVRIGNGKRLGERRGLPSFKGSGNRMPIAELCEGDLVQFAAGEFQKWEFARDWAVMPLDSLELVIKEERSEES